MDFFWNAMSGIRRKKNQRLAAMLDELENILPPESDEFQAVRKIVLDFFNDYYRDVVKLLLGIEVEGRL